MPQQGRPVESPSEQEVEDEAVGEANPVVEDGPEDFYNAFQELIDWARDVLNNYNRLEGEPEVPDPGPRRVGLRARPGEILMPVGFFGRAVVGDNFHQRIHRGAIFERPNDEQIIEDVEADQVFESDQPDADQVIERIESDQPDADQVVEGIESDQPDAVQVVEGIESDQPDADQVVERIESDQPDADQVVERIESDQLVAEADKVVERIESDQALTEADQLVERVEGDQDVNPQFAVASEAERVVIPEASQQIVVADEADQRSEMAAEVVQRPAEVSPRLAEFIHRLSDAVLRLAMAANAIEGPPMAAEAVQGLGMVAEAIERLATVAEANERVEMVAEANQRGAIDVEYNKVTLCTQADQETTTATEGDQEVGMFAEANKVSEDSRMVAEVDKLAAHCPDADQEAALCDTDKEY